MVSPLGLGCVWIGSGERGFGDEQAVATVLRALDLGINLVDTSPLYQGEQSERRLGLALAEFLRRGGRREQIVVSTKTGTRTRPYDYSGDATRRSVERSLRLLGLDYIDVMHIHDPPDLEQALSSGGALDVLEELKAQGVIRAIGLGVRDHALHRLAIQTGRFDVVLTYRDYNLLDQSAAAGVLPHAAAAAMGVFNGTPIIKGLLGGRDPRVVAAETRASGAHETYQPTDAEIARAAALWDMAQEHGVDMLAINLQFCLRELRIASTLIGAASPAEIEVDVAAVMRPIPPAVWDSLAAKLRPQTGV
jgi:aryl-alcohol dehydrogenase-like predicted oxidoreductase